MLYNISNAPDHALYKGLGVLEEACKFLKTVVVDTRMKKLQRGMALLMLGDHTAAGKNLTHEAVIGACDRSACAKKAGTLVSGHVHSALNALGWSLGKKKT